MNSKRKLLISMLAIVFVLLAVVATIAIAFALTQQTITTSVNIGYTVEDIDGSASATYTIGGVTNYLEPIADAEHVSQDNRSLLFKAGDLQNAGNLMFPEGQIPLTAQNDNIVIQYTYSNTGPKHYIASMTFDATLIADNMKVEYSIDGTTYSEQRYAVVVPAHTSNRSYWIKISIENKAKNASFVGDFNWLLSACDPQAESYLSLTSLEFQGSNGSYSASVSTSGAYAGQLVYPSAVNGDPVTTIAQNTSLTQEQKNQVLSVYLPDSVTTISNNAFENFTNLQNVQFEQNETGSASAQSSAGLTTIGQYAFKSCTNLESITIPDTVTTIGQYAFNLCTSLKEAKLPAGITEIPQYIFYKCSALERVNIPENVTTIGAHAFLSCSKVKRVDITNINKYAQINYLYVSSNGQNPIGYGGGLYLNGELVTDVVLDNTVVTMGNLAFYNYDKLESISISSSVTTIGPKSISYCDPLRIITVDAGNSAFKAVNNCLIEKATKKIIKGTDLSIIPQDEGIEIIGDSAFENYSGENVIIIPNTVKTIEKYAFYYATGIIDLTIPESVESIADLAFSGCTYVRNFYYNTNKIVDGWYNASSNSVWHPFYNLGKDADELNVVFGENVTIVPQYILDETYVSNVQMHENITEIRNHAFYGCERLTEIAIPSKVTEIATRAFCGCDNLKNVVFYENNQLKRIGDDAFRSCGIMEIVIPSGVTEIVSGAFQNCGNLELIVFESKNTLTKIGNYAFYGCTSLKCFEIPTSVTSIGSSSFLGCNNLLEIIDARTTPMQAGEYGTISDINVVAVATGKNYLSEDSNGFTYYDLGDGTYKVFSYDGNATEIVFPSTYNGGAVVGIRDYIFDKNTTITKITIPSSIETIGSYAFNECSALSSVVFEQGGHLKSIGNYAFNKTAVKSITLPSSVVSIGKCAFQSCKSLTNIDLGESLQSIGSYAFNICSAITTIELPNTLISIGEYAFQNCSKLTSIKIPNTVTTMGSYTFNQCSLLVSVEFEEGCQVSEWGYYTFGSCKSLKSITIPQSITKIGQYCFSGCSALAGVYISDLAKWCNISMSSGTNPLSNAKKLYLNGELVTNLVIPEGVTTIKAYAFYNCTSITSVTIGKDVETIGNQSFYGCANLANVIFAENGQIKEIQQWAFQKCTALQTITIPTSITKIYYYAFSGCTNLTSVTFENPNGWFYATSSSATSGTDLLASDLSNTSTAATYLKTTYYSKYWIRK